MENHLNTNKIPTAEEFKIIKYSQNIFNDNEIMIEFAKLHVEAALKQASEGVIVNYTDDYACKGDREMDSDYILNAYPLENIK